MANVKICHRCGAQFVEKAGRITVDPVRYVLCKTTRTRFLWNNHDIYAERDLCVKCVDDLERFLKGEAVEAIKENVDGDLD